MKGTVKFFNRRRGWGYITGEDGTDVFVHYSGITGEGFKTLKENQAVTYELGENEKGPTAINVKAE